MVSAFATQEAEDEADQFVTRSERPQDKPALALHSQQQMSRHGVNRVSLPADLLQLLGRRVLFKGCQAANRDLHGLCAPRHQGLGLALGIWTLYTQLTPAGNF